MNISAGKNFDVHEQMKLQFRFDASNAFNHTNLGLPGGGAFGLGGASAVGGLYTFNPGTATNSGDQQINGTTSGGRTVQFAAHLLF